MRTILFVLKGIIISIVFSSLVAGSEGDKGVTNRNDKFNSAYVTNNVCNCEVNNNNLNYKDLISADDNR